MSVLTVPAYKVVDPASVSDSNDFFFSSYIVIKNYFRHYVGNKTVFEDLNWKDNIQSSVTRN